jgi:hypothetical protein
LLDRALTNRMLTLKYKKVLIKGLALWFNWTVKIYFLHS